MRHDASLPRNQPVGQQPLDAPPQGSQGSDETHRVWQQPTEVTNNKPLRQISRCNGMGSLSLNTRSVGHPRRNLLPLRIDQSSPQTLRILPVFRKTPVTAVERCAQQVMRLAVATTFRAAATGHIFRGVDGFECPSFKTDANPPLKNLGRQPDSWWTPAR